MGKTKIHEIAKEVGLTSKEIIKIARDLGIEVTSHLSAVDDDQANKIRKNIISEQQSDQNIENKEDLKKAESEEKNHLQEKTKMKNLHLELIKKNLLLQMQRKMRLLLLLEEKL